MIMSDSRRRLIGSAAAWGAFSIIPRHVLGGPGFAVANFDRLTVDVYLADDGGLLQVAQTSFGTV